MELWHLLVAMAIMLAIAVGVAVYMNKRGKLTPEASAALQRVLAGDVHSSDDFLKAVLADPALKKQYAGVLASLDMRLRAADMNLRGGVTAAEHFMTTWLPPMPIPPAPPRPTAPRPTAPPDDVAVVRPDSDGIEAYAAKVGIAAAEMRLAARLHPSYTWEQLAAWIKDPSSSRDFSDADRDSIAAAAPHEPLNG